MKKILVTGGMLTYMLLVNAGVASVYAAPDLSDHDRRSGHYESARHQKNMEAKLVRLANKLGLDPDLLQDDINSNKSIKEILKSHGITKQQLKEVMGNRRHGRK